MRPAHLPALALLSLFALPAVAPASDWFPIEPGQRTQLTNDAGTAVLTRVFTIEQELPDGSEATRLENSEQLPEGYTDHYWNYWSQEPEGVYLHGFWLPGEGWGIVHDPPILWMASDAGPGASWESTSTPRDWATLDPVGDPTVTRSEIVGTPTLELPAGQFATVQLDWGQPLPPALHRHAVARDALGRRLEGGLARAGASDHFEWYAQSQGLVQQNRWWQTELFVLRLSSAAVSSERMTWGALKGRETR